MTRDFTIHDILFIMLKSWWLIIILAIVSGVLAFSYSAFVIDAKYTSKGTLYVNVNGSNYDYKNEISKGELDTSARLVETYRIILKSDSFLNKVADDVKLGYLGQDLKNMVQMSAINNTEILQISTINNNPEHARIITQSILDFAQDEIMRVVKAGSVEIIDNATLSLEPSSPNKTFNTFVGLLVGIVTAFLIVIIKELFDIRIRGEEDLMSRYTIPILGAIPNLSEEK